MKKYIRRDYKGNPICPICNGVMIANALLTFKCKSCGKMVRYKEMEELNS